MCFDADLLHEHAALEYWGSSDPSYVGSDSCEVDDDMVDWLCLRRDVIVPG